VADRFGGGIQAHRQRVRQVRGKAKGGGFRARLQEETKDVRRKQIQESLKQFESREKKRSNRPSVKTLLMRAGLDVSPRQFWVGSAMLGALCGILTYLAGVPLVVALVAAVAGMLGLPGGYSSTSRSAGSRYSSMTSPTPST
jgi:tight adherence protein B